MNVTAILSVVVALTAVVGVPTAVLTARSSIRDGRRAQSDSDERLQAKGFAAGVASVQAQLYDLKNQVATLTDDRNYWRGLRGGGTDERSAKE